MTSIAERYLTATTSSQLGHDPNHVCDADRLLAAAYATAGDPFKSLALDVYRLRATASMAGSHSIAERMAGKVVNKSRPKRGGKPEVSRIEAVDLCLVVLKWWHMQACPVCEGRGHPHIPGTPLLDTARQCGHCDGTGIRPLKKHVKAKHLDLAHWLVDSLNGLTAIVFSDMAQRMPKLEI